MALVCHTSVKTSLLDIINQWLHFVALITEEVSKILTDNSDFLSENSEVVNFEKRRLLAQSITLLQCYQSVPYSFTPVQSLQDKLLTMEVHTTEQELLQLSWQSEMT